MTEGSAIVICACCTEQRCGPLGSPMQLATQEDFLCDYCRNAYSCRLAMRAAKEGWYLS